MTRFRSTLSTTLAILAAGSLVACTARTADSPVEQFWGHLSALCGKAYAGSVVEAPAGDSTFANKELVMHVRECDDSVIRVPFHVGEDRSRTWVISRTAQGLRLKHDHRHADGVEDSVTQYGGDSRSPVLAHRAEFPADSFTKALIPAASTNIWTVEIDSTSAFTYALRREGTDRRFRITFDLSREVALPPAPWGFEDK